MIKKIFSTLLIIFLLACPAIATVDFNGDADYIDIGACPDIGNNEGFSISLWVNAASDGDIIFQCQDSNPLYYIQVGALAGVGTANKATLLLRSDSGSGLTGLEGFSSSTTIAGAGWFHVGATLAGDETVEIYINGDDDGGGTYSYAEGAFTVNSGSDHWLSTSGGSPLDGMLSEVAFWKHTDGTPLTANEMAQLGKSRVKGMPLQIQPSELQRYYPLDDYPEGHGTLASTTLLDMSGNNNGSGTDADNDSDFVAESNLSYP